MYVSTASDERPRVVMLLENFWYPQDVRVRLEADSLAAAGYDVEVIAPRAPGQPAVERVGAVRVRRVRVFRPQSDSAIGFLVEYLIALPALHLHALRTLLSGARVLHLHNPPDLLFLAGALYRLAGRSVVFDHHDLFPELVDFKTSSKWLTKAAGVAERLTYAVANQVLTTNESYAEIARRRGSKQLQQVTVVRNAPPDAWLERPLNGRTNGADPRRVHLGYLGELSSHDGVGSLIPLLQRLSERGLDAHLTIIGEGDARPGLERAVADQGLESRVTFTGWVSFEAVPKLLESVDICVDPAPSTEYNERSTMTKIAEYLSLGRPTVAYALMETRRTAGDAAVLVPPGDEAGFTDAVVALAGDPELRRRLSLRARRRCQSLSWSHSEAALIAAYRRVAPAGARPESPTREGCSLSQGDSVPRAEIKSS